MHNFLIFLPECEFENWNAGFLYGNVFHTEIGTAIYVLGSQHPLEHQRSSQYEKVGEIGAKQSSISSNNWLFIQTNGGHIDKVSVFFERPYNVRIVLYNRDHIKRSQWLDRMRFQDNDFTFRLINEVKNEAVLRCNAAAPSSDDDRFTIRVAQFLLCALQTILNVSKNQWFATLINISTFGFHFFTILESFASILKRFTSGKRLNVREMNYILARILDTVFGQIIIFYVMSHMSSAEMFSALSNFQEFVVAYLRNTVEWLMGSPAGFKLNCPLNNVLGPFYQFHISLWWTFLRLSKPLLWVIFHFLLFLGNFGLSLQVAILADVLAIVSVHIYCIYVYAARLYFFQMKGLKILSRLFIGKKRNPLPGTEHSSPYTTEQLLFGTVSFTILFFLLPTTLIYYCVFTAIRILLILLGGILTRVRILMMVFPIYVTWLWFHDPVCLTCTVRLSNKMRYLTDGTLVTKIKPVCQSWWRTVQMNATDSVNYSGAIEWKKLITDVLVGNLIYPV